MLVGDLGEELVLDLLALLLGLADAGVLAGLGARTALLDLGVARLRRRREAALLRAGEAALRGRERRARLGVERRARRATGEVRRLAVAARDAGLAVLAVLLRRVARLVDGVAGRPDVARRRAGLGLLTLVGGAGDVLRAVARLALGLLLGVARLVHGALRLLLLGLEARVGRGRVVVAHLAVRADPLVRGCGLVDLAQALLVGASEVGGVRRGVGGDVAREEADVLEELARLRVGEDELAEGAEVLDGLVAVLLHLALVGAGRDVLQVVDVGRVGLLGVVAAGEGARTRVSASASRARPGRRSDTQEVLEELVVVLLDDDLAEDADDICRGGELESVAAEQEEGGESRTHRACPRRGSGRPSRACARRSASGRWRSRAQRRTGCEAGEGEGQHRLVEQRAARRGDNETHSLAGSLPSRNALTTPSILILRSVSVAFTRGCESARGRRQGRAGRRCGGGRRSARDRRGG